MLDIKNMSDEELISKQQELWKQTKILQPYSERWSLPRIVPHSFDNGYSKVAKEYCDVCEELHRRHIIEVMV